MNQQQLNKQLAYFYVQFHGIVLPLQQITYIYERNRDHRCFRYQKLHQQRTCATQPRWPECGGPAFHSCQRVGHSKKANNLQTAHETCRVETAAHISRKCIVSYRINLVDHLLQGNEVLVLPSDTIVEVLSLSKDFAAEALTAIDLPGIDGDSTDRLLPKEEQHLFLEEADRKCFGAYFDLLHKQMTRSTVSESSISLVFLAMVADTASLNRTMCAGNTRQQSRGEKIMARFIHLLQQFGATHRNIPFYAEQLHVTPNHLSDVVRQHSGLSVMDWIHRTTTTEAKLLLKHTDLMIYEISQRLNFPEPTAFNRYFKKQTGVTPLAYRNSL